MVFSLNKVMIVGNLVSDPVVRATPSGTPVGDLRIAVNRNYKDGQGNYQKETVYITVVVWGRNAENCAQYLKIGRPVYIEGRLVQDTWKAADGTSRSQIKISAERVTFISTPQRAAGAGHEGGEEEFPGGGMDSFDAGESPEDLPF